MQTDTKAFTTELLIQVVDNPWAHALEVGELLAWMTGESWKKEDYAAGIDICVPWLKAWFPELTKPEAWLKVSYDVPQINR